MGIFSDRKPSSNFSPSASLSASPSDTASSQGSGPAAPEVAMHFIDTRPSTEEVTPSDVLVGWAFASGRKAQAEVFLDNRLVLSVPCASPRHDVHQSFSEITESLLCGFEIEFPLTALSRLSAGRLEVRLNDGASIQSIWEWQGALPGKEREEAAREVRLHFSALREGVQRVRAAGVRGDSDPASYSLNIVISSHGSMAALHRSLSALTLLGKNDSLPAIAGVSILADDRSQKEQISSLLKRYAGISARVGTRDELSTWAQICVSASNTDGLVLYCEENAVLEHMDLPAFVRDFLDLPSISLLSPAVYGAPDSTNNVAAKLEGSLSGPLGVNLSSLRESTLVHGADMPALVRSETAGPVWISTASFLESFEQNIGTIVGRLSLPSRGDGLSFFSDVRQAICLGGHSSFAYSPEESRQLQFVADSQLQLTANAASRIPEVIVLLDSDDIAAGPVSAELRQIQALASELSEQGADVLLVEDAAQVTAPYFGGLAVVSIDELCESEQLGARQRLESSWILAGSWKCVRSAAALRYRFACSAAVVVQELAHEEFHSANREQFDLARWAMHAEMLPITTNPSLAERAAQESDSFVEAVSIGYRLDREQFFPLPRGASENSVLIALGNNSRQKIAAAEVLLKELRSALPGLSISISDLPECGAPALALIDSADRVYGNLDQVQSADLLSSHALMLDCSFLGEKSPAALEAVSCGAAVISCSLAPLPNSNGDQVSPALVEEIKRTTQTAVALLGSSAALAESQMLRVRELEQLKTEVTQGFVEKLNTAQATQLKRLRAERAEPCGVTIIVPVYCALDATVQCLRSVIKHAPKEFEVIVVNDVSDAGTTAALEQMAASSKRIQLINKTENGGFVQSCLTGYAAAKPGNDIILLNSDVVLTEGSLESLRAAAYSRPRTALSSSLSTNSPHLQIDLNPGDSLEGAAKKIRELKDAEHPTIITPEGQLLYIRRWALEKFGFFDPVYNRGFCEESDLCMRMFLHGVDMVVADDSLILHRKSESFGLEGGLQYKRENRPIFDARWGRHYWMVYPEFLERNPLREIRSRYKALTKDLQGPHEPIPIRNLPSFFSRLAARSRANDLSADVLEGVDVVFLVPSVILGGGTLSVLQHANEMMMRGVEARVLTLTEPDPIRYPYLAPPIAVSAEQLMELDWSKQKVVATFWLTAYYVKALTHRYPELEGFYYIQDYEPWFYSRPDKYPTIREAERSYELGLRGAAKTEYLRDVVKREHDLDINVITPGLAQTVFYPGQQEKSFGRPTLTAYYRPRTPRRGGEECIEILKQVKARVPEAKLQLFGEDVELSPELEGVVESLGRMSQADVAKLYRQSDIVMDMSYWHGFGRMGIESMACGAVPILSDSGGIRTYARDMENSFIVSLDDLDGAADRVVQLLKDKELRLRMRENGLESVKRFSESAAVDDWMDLMGLEAPRSDEEGISFPGVRNRPAARSKVVNF